MDDLDVTIETSAELTPDEVNDAYAWADWPRREAWRLEAVARTCTWIAARTPDGQLVGIVRVLDDGGLHAALWDLLVREDVRRRGLGTRLVTTALGLVRDRSLLAMVSTPEAVPLFTRLGFVPEAHGHTALYLRPFKLPSADASPARPETPNLS